MRLTAAHKSLIVVRNEMITNKNKLGGISLPAHKPKEDPGMISLLKYLFKFIVPKKP